MPALRLALYAGILVVSVAGARALLRRAPEPGRGDAASVPAPAPAAPAAEGRGAAPSDGEPGADDEGASDAARTEAGAPSRPGPRPDADVGRVPAPVGPAAASGPAPGAPRCPPEMALHAGRVCTVAGVPGRAGGPAGAAGSRPPGSDGCVPGARVAFCIDRLEYPNLLGVRPASVVSFAQARRGCAVEGKRLCTDAEWSFACAGPEGARFPQGDQGTPADCHLLAPPLALSRDALWGAAAVTRAVLAGDARVASGSLPTCVTPSGVFDLLGNVEEWVVLDRSGTGPRLRGGDARSGPTTCSRTRIPGAAGSAALHSGFRCCRDPSPPPSPPAGG